jgi:hypothetical protein
LPRPQHANPHFLLEKSRVDQWGKSRTCVWYQLR